jgi:pilus assembly protein Flp/PilA
MARRVCRDQRGQGLVEYALIIALVSLASVVALGFLSGKVDDIFFKSGNVLNDVEVLAAGGGGPGPPPSPDPPADGTAITSGNSSPFSNAGGTYYAAGQIQACDAGVANYLACLFGAGTWTTVDQPGVYAASFTRSGACSFTYTATGYSFAGTWAADNLYRTGSSGGPDFGEACL